GSFFVFVVTDPLRQADRPRGEVFEGPGEANNARPSAVPLVIELPPPSDLQVDDIAIPLTGRAGDPVTVTWAVSNHGDFPAAGAWSDKAYLSEDAVWDVSDRPLGRVAFSGKLQQGQGYTATLNTALPPVTPGTYHVIVRPDIFNEVFEGGR